MIKYTDLLKLCIVASLILQPMAKAAPGNGNSAGSNGGQSGAVNNGGSTTGGSTTGLNGGNNGSGVGNTGPGNQGNDKPVGNAGGSTGSSTGGSSTGGTSGNSDNGNTGGFSGGNNGNGNGNTGPGNQGNDTPNGNAGGTTGSSTGGSSTGGSSGNSDNGNTGGFSGGNNGNGNGNTGPGNQGNDTPNGNAGGTTGSTTGGSETGSSNGGNNGNANGGSNGGTNGNSDNGNTGGFSGGNNGNGNGNTGPGNQGNDGDNGNACGNNCTTGSTSGGTTGSTDGGTTGSTTGSTDGGTTGSTTGSTTGGSETTGSTDGGNTTGGETSGGATTGGTETTGSTDGGTTTGGETSGGTTSGGTETTGGESTGGTETTGGETGESTGGETGETSGGETGETTGGTSGETTEAKKEKFKARLLPLAFGNYDIANTAVNLTPADERDLRNNEARLDQYEDGFIVTQMRMWDAGLGAMPQVFIENASGLAALPTAAIGLALTKGRYVQYERLVSDEEALNSLKSIPLPTTKKSLDQYQVGESAYFESNGGVVFLAGAGALGAYAGGSILAEGSFRTLVRKTGANKAIVQIARASIRTASLYTGAAVLKLDGTRVKQLSHGFNYEFDFSRGGILTVKAFEQLVAGNVSAAQEQALTPDLTGVSRVSEAKSLEVMKKRGVSLGIPMVAMYNWAAGKTYGETATKTYADRTTTDLNYGVYFKEEKGRFFHKHKKITRSFYATKAVTKDEKAKVLATNEEANYFWSYENDSANSRSLNSAMALFHKDLGLKSAFNPIVASGEKLRFVRLQANVKIPESYMKKLISETLGGRGRAEMQRDAQALINRYFSSGDELNLCKNDEDGAEINDCQQSLTRESMNAVNRIQATLANLKDKKDSGSYTYAIALMGKELVKNQFVMNAFFAQDKSCSVNFDVKLEGRRLSRIMTKIPANKNCRR